MEYAIKNLEELGFKDYCITKTGRVYSLKSKRFLNLQYNDNGYVCVTLRVDGKTKTLRVHRLVALSFLTESYFQDAHVNHKDGDKTNNDLCNLEWVNRSDNMIHAYKAGLVLSKQRQLDDHTVHLICQTLEQGTRIPDIAKMFSVDKELVYRIESGRAYNYISFEYDMSKVPKQRKLSPEKVIDVCELLATNVPVRLISKKTDVNESTVKAIKQRRTQTHISNSYNW